MNDSKDEKPAHTIVICMGSSCFARGNQDNLTFIKQYIAEKKLEKDVHLRGTLCEDICNQGPIVIINGTKFTQITPISLHDILDHALNQEKP